MGVLLRPCFELNSADILSQPVVYIPTLSLHIRSVIVIRAAELSLSGISIFIVPDCWYIIINEITIRGNADTYACFRKFLLIPLVTPPSTSICK